MVFKEKGGHKTARAYYMELLKHTYLKQEQKNDFWKKEQEREEILDVKDVLNSTKIKGPKFIQFTKIKEKKEPEEPEENLDFKEMSKIARDILKHQRERQETITEGELKRISFSIHNNKDLFENHLKRLEKVKLTGKVVAPVLVKEVKLLIKSIKIILKQIGNIEKYEDRIYNISDVKGKLMGYMTKGKKLNGWINQFEDQPKYGKKIDKWKEELAKIKSEYKNLAVIYRRLENK